ncbi:hypothetical protein [Tenacibaculum sp. IB213877]|uniref:hypothetical protein n=1 Tax=Tenacibaculum sp. IB213877 TaxID=3097351 RepID=UPI002A5ADA8E|nr:hypothetical protein [Tenacibaculum sp. IB213877]MDY0779880.1 hypothetical protein [Tenacibaculum sp. IB213877]
MRKIIPYLYIAFGLIILVDTATQVLANKQVYKIIFSWQTESRLVFILVKSLFAFVFMFYGYNRLRLVKNK